AGGAADRCAPPEQAARVVAAIAITSGRPAPARDGCCFKGVLRSGCCGGFLLEVSSLGGIRPEAPERIRGAAVWLNGGAAASRNPGVGGRRLGPCRRPSVRQRRNHWRRARVVAIFVTRATGRRSAGWTARLGCPPSADPVPPTRAAAPCRMAAWALGKLDEG